MIFITITTIGYILDNLYNLIAAIFGKTNFGVIIIQTGLFSAERNKIITDFADFNFFSMFAF